MKKRNILFIIIFALIVLTLISFIIPKTCYAEDLGLGNLSKYKGTAKTPTDLSNRVGKALGYIQTIGIVLSVVILIVIGIKYMLGSIEEKAEYKQTMIPYLIGAFLLFTGTLLPNIIYQFAKNI